MAILDSQTQFCSAMALTNGTTITATNLLDLSILGKVFGTTQPVYMYLIWTGTPAGTNLRIQLTSTASTTDGTSTPSFHWDSGVITSANSGYTNSGFTSGVAPTLIAMPNGVFNPITTTGGASGATAVTGPYKKNLALVLISTGDNTAGILTAGLTQVVDMHSYQASGFTGPT